MTPRQEVRVLTAVLVVLVVAVALIDLLLGFVFAGLSVLIVSWGLAVTKRD